MYRKYLKFLRTSRLSSRQAERFTLTETRGGFSVIRDIRSNRSTTLRPKFGLN